MLEPWYRNFFDNMATVQFDHRMIAWTLAILIPVFWYKSRSLPLPGSTRLACSLLLIMLAIQISLGIATLLLVVPLPLAAAHQAGALLLFTAALWVNHQLRRAERMSALSPLNFIASKPPPLDDASFFISTAPPFAGRPEASPERGLWKGDRAAGGDASTALIVIGGAGIPLRGRNFLWKILLRSSRSRPERRQGYPMEGDRAVEGTS